MNGVILITIYITHRYFFSCGLNEDQPINPINRSINQCLPVSFLQMNDLSKRNEIMIYLFGSILDQFTSERERERDRERE